jgi:catechol 2,3-dioxygenase-like lactoylglutathione lyase family enzyme
MLKTEGVLETCVYVDDMEQAHAFYHGLLGLDRMLEDGRLSAYDAGDRSVLLIFLRDEAINDIETPGGLVPGHNSTGPAHFAFRIDAESLGRWKLHLEARNVRIVSEVDWGARGKSIYINDPAGNVVELATPRLWPNASAGDADPA